MLQDSVEPSVWPRWWVPVGSDAADISGFLDDPNGPYARYFDRDTRPLAEMADVDCLILLGEAGMGKSTEIAAETARLRAASVAVALFDLGDDPDVASLRHSIVEDPTVKAWVADTTDLVIFLDSFDEAMVTIDKLVGGLIRLLDALPRERLKLRIVSRSSAWSSRLDGELAERFVRVERLTLCPLRRGDAAAAAAAVGLDPERFLSDVASRDLGVIAARPLTLRMLVQVAKAGAIPMDRTELYRDAVRLLGRENSLRRQEERTTDLPVEERLRIARRLAALSLLSGHATLRTHPDPEASTPALVLDDLARDPADPPHLVEVLSSGLFAASAGGGARFTHRSIAEFLVGQTLAEVPLATVAYLLEDPLHTGHIVPQLAGTAIFAAALDASIYAWLAETEPELLLTANLASATEEQRRILGRAVLRDLGESGPRLERRYWWLHYPELADDLAPFFDDGQDLWTKIAAAGIVSDSGCRGLDDRLVKMIEGIAERQPPAYLGDDLRLASNLIFALEPTQDDALLERLFAVAHRVDAPEHLRAELLSRLWGRRPTERLLAAVDGLDALSPGSPMASTVADGLADAIDHGQVAPAHVAAWFERSAISAPTDQQRHETAVDHAWHAVVSAAAFRLATDNGSLIGPQRDVIARAMLAWFAETHDVLPNDRPWPRPLSADERRELIGVLLPKLPDRVAAIYFVRAGLLDIDDLEWIVDQWGRAVTAVHARNAHHLLEALVDRADDAHKARVLAAARPFHALIAAVDELFDPAIVAHIVAEREGAAEQARAAKRSTAARQFDTAALSAALAARDWPRTDAELTKNVSGQQHALGAPLTHAPAWIDLDATSRAAVVDCAAEFLCHQPGDPVVIPHVDAYGHAYQLVNDQRPGVTAALDPDMVLSWLKAVRRRPGHNETVQTMITHVGVLRSDALDRELVVAIADDGALPAPWQITMLGSYTSPAVENALHELAKAPDTQGQVLQSALVALLRRNEQAGLGLATHLIVRRPSARPTGMLGHAAWRRAVHACAAIITSPAAAGQLDSTLAVLAASRDFAVAVVRTAGRRSLDGPVWPGLDSAQLADLYLWAHRTLPPEPEQRPGAVVSSDIAHELPSFIFNRLSATDEPAAVKAIERIADELGESWPRRSAADMARRLRQRAWVPLSVETVDAILADPSLRAVTSEAQLAQIVLGAIDDVADEIASNPDIASLFWHEQSNTKPTTWRPVDEPTFTTRFVERMSGRLVDIIVRQEGQLNLHVGEIKGSEPDIEAVALHHGVELSVLGEVKGNWHAEVYTAIETQLTERYLAGARTSTGIYLVAHFSSGRWDETDTRLGKARPRTVEQLRRELTASAKALSVGGVAVHVRVVPIEI